MEQNKPNRRRELLAILLAAIVCIGIAVGFVLIDPSGNKAPDVVTDSQRAVDPDTMAPQR